MRFIVSTSRRLVTIVIMITCFGHFGIFAQAKTEPLEGAVDLDSEKSSEAELMAYMAVSNATNTMSQRICSVLPQNSNVAVFEATTKKQIVDYRNMQILLDSLERRFRATIPANLGLRASLEDEAELRGTSESGRQLSGEAEVLKEAANIATGLGSINEAMGALQDLLGFFKTDISEKGFEVTATKEEMLPELVGQLIYHCNGKNIRFYNPNDMPFSTSATASSLLNSLASLYILRYQAENVVQKIKGMKLASDARVAQITNATNQGAAPAFIANLQAEQSAFDASYGRLQQTKNQLVALISQFDAIASVLMKVDDDAGPPLLVSLFEAENLVSFMQNRSGYLLEFGSNVSGGTRRVKKNLFLDLFLPTGRITFNGSAAIRYTLYNPAGDIGSGCVVKTYMNFRRAKNIAKATPEFTTTCN